MDVEFDDAAASALIGVARAVDDALRAQGATRRSAAETAMDGFSGRYAELLCIACATESEERGRLSRAMDDLARQVRRSKQQAEAENVRRRELVAWQMRDADRDERNRAAFFGEIVGDVEKIFDPRPTSPPLDPSPISIAFSSTQRTRTSSGAGSASSGADTDHLRAFVVQAKACNVVLRHQVERLSKAWTRFVASSSWVPIGTVSFLSGAMQLVDENDEDVVWVEHIATAFEQAGSGTLTNRSLDLAVAAFLEAQGNDPVDLLSHMDPEVAAAWLAANPSVLEGLVTSPPSWGTPSTILQAIVAAERAIGAEPAHYASVLQQLYVTRAAEKTGIDLATWNTSWGAPALMGQVAGSYEYYASLYLDNPDFTWAGMANLVGPDFAAGFLDLHSFRDHVATIAPLLPPSMRPFSDQLAGMGEDELAFYEKTFLDMQKNIFFDASTMHEAYLDDGMAGIMELQAAGLLRGPNQSEQQAAVSAQTTLEAWQDIDNGIRTGRTDLVDSGNEALLYREQHDTIQRGYDQMRDHDPTGEALTTMLGIVGDASIPDTMTLGQYEGGFSVPLDYMPSIPGVQGQIETWNIPTTNISDFRVRWDYIENDTLPAWQELAHGDPERARELVGDSVPDRIDERRLDDRLGGLLDDLHDAEFAWQ